MVKWYDRIGNTIEMRVGRGWIKGTVIDGERTGDGIVNMETADEKKYWCGVGTEGVWYRKTDDSLGDLFTEADRIRSMSDEELAEFLERVEAAGYNDSSITPRMKNGFPMDMLDWLKLEAKE